MLLVAVAPESAERFGTYEERVQYCGLVALQYLHPSYDRGVSRTAAAKARTPRDPMGEASTEWQHLVAEHTPRG